MSAPLTVALVEDVVAVLADHGEHPPTDRVAASLDQLLHEAD